MKNAIRRIGFTATMMGLLAAAANTANADPTLIADFTAGTFPGNDYQIGTFGYSFTVGNDPLLVTALAAAYAGAEGEVYIYVPGSASSVAAAAVNYPPLQTTTSPNGNVYGYTFITPTLLSANTTYDIVWSDAVSGQAYTTGATAVSYSSDLTIGSGISAPAVGATPTTDEANLGITFGPSFAATPVPEPSTLVSAGIAGLLGLGYVWHRRKAKATA